MGAPLLSITTGGYTALYLFLIVASPLPFNACFPCWYGLSDLTDTGKLVVEGATVGCPS